MPKRKPPTFERTQQVVEFTIKSAAAVATTAFLLTKRFASLESATQIGIIVICLLLLAKEGFLKALKEWKK